MLVAGLRSLGSLVHYRTLGLTIRSENAAKPAAQASRRLVTWLRSEVNCNHALDYGCGKLRYAPTLTRVARSVTFVDSVIQLDRRQLLYGKRTTVRTMVSRRWPQARVLDLKQFADDKRLYDFVLCANVLSAIPNRSVRSQAVRKLARHLTCIGRCLFVTQHRNTDFQRMSRLRCARPYLDGWILQSKHGASYYGILDRIKLVSLVRQCGHHVLRAWVSGESTFVLTSANAPNTR